MAGLVGEWPKHRIEVKNMAKKKVKKLYKSKTVVVAVLTAVAGILTAVLAELPELRTVGWLAIAKSIIDFSLRYVTEEPVK